MNKGCHILDVEIAARVKRRKRLQEFIILLVNSLKSGEIFEK